MACGKACSYIINKKIKILTQEQFFSCYVANQFVFSPSHLTKSTPAKNACFGLDFLSSILFMGY